MTGKHVENNAKIIIPAAIGLWLVASLVFNNKVPGWLQVVAKLTISLPKTLAERFKAYVPPRQRNTFIAEALEERLAIEEQSQAIAESAGSWSDERHPDMATGGEIDSWLATLRGRWHHPDGD